MNRMAFYLRMIEKNYPALKIDEVSLNREGQYNDVLLINNTLIFRFPKVMAAVESLQHEVLILEHLQDRISLKIPNPVFYNIETDKVHEAFFGYRMIPGKPLWREDFMAIQDENIIEGIACQLSGFLHELHHIDTQEVIPIELPIGDNRMEWASLYDRIREKLFVYMRPDAINQVEQHFEVYLENPDKHNFDPVLRHGDFGTGNILYEHDRSSVTGIIDFAIARAGDPAVDFAGLYASYGEVFYRRCYSVYPEMEHALERVLFYYGTFALQEALFGIKNGDQKAFLRGIATYACL